VHIYKGSAFINNDVRNNEGLIAQLTPGQRQLLRVTKVLKKFFYIILAYALLKRMSSIF